MIKMNEKSISNVYSGGKSISKILKGTKLVWTKGNSVEDYQQIEYIESTGTQWIDTGIIPNGNMEFEVEVALYENSSTTYIFGADINYYTGYNMSIDWNYRTTEGIRGVFGGNTNGAYMLISKVNPIVETKYNMSLKKNQIKVGDKVVSNTKNWAGTEITWPIIIFGTNRNNEATVLRNLRVYDFKVYENGELIQNLVPCYRKSDNAIGMYDLVNNVFYENQGTGEFTAGEIVG